MELKDLIGYKLEKINDKEIIVSKENQLYTLEFEENEGDCCGYNELETNLLIDEKNKPIITNVKYKDIGGKTFFGDDDTIEITFFGENKEIAKIKSRSSSGSGWCYNACVTIKCKELNINETLSEW